MDEMTKVWSFLLILNLADIAWIKTFTGDQIFGRGNIAPMKKGFKDLISNHISLQ